ncbi:uncharacterized protein [Watersipora subatra]|uniref:uncharacterized protein n=1 Tax=Watersipora subatra TaxID=2589382 RepID=UPI00355B3582
MPKLLIDVLLLALLGVVVKADGQTLEYLEQRLAALELQHSEYRQVITSLARQIGMQQFYVEEITRASGDSGLKQARVTHTGTRTYHTTSYSDVKVAAIHDHSNYPNTLGMGEIIAVLNGVEFRTRHNDYKLVMPSRTSKVYGATEPIPFPEVPPEVLAKGSVEEQEEEMRLWFKAFKDQNPSVRDYRKYFKPVLCYMEGMWTESNGDSMDEPFESDRHFLAADSFFDLQDKAQYTSATGRKDIGENYAFLPTKLSRMTDSGFPVYSQWNYKILCHPLKKDVPLSRFRLEDDLGARVARSKSYEKAQNERFARFSLWPPIAGVNSQFRPTKEGYTRLTTGSYLESLMAEIPGKDNYMGDIVDDVFNETAYDHTYRPSLNNREEGAALPQPKNVAYYHRLYKTKTRDAMGSEIRHRAFSDASLYIAYNTRSQITPTSLNWCRKNRRCSPSQAWRGECEAKICSSWTHRVSYAIPLEIVYLNPLQSWNPYDFKLHEADLTPQNWGTNMTYKRTGESSIEKAIHGNSNIYYYRTPRTFFDGGISTHDQADTARASMAVLDQNGVMRQTRASGIHIMTPRIPGVGIIRQRYPIMPVHQAGSFEYKELDALKDVTLEAGVYKRFYRHKREMNGTLEEVFTFEISNGDRSPVGPHHHTVDLTESQITKLRAGERVEALTSSNAGHSHEVTLEYRVATYPDKDLEHLFITKCDNQDWMCYDGHKGWSICNECPDGFPDA